ncbi:DNA topoisomerase-1 [Blastomonas natatoria]|uniref:DNA topoisomerase n=1 Tax=Blastomonas natatoria TaxID=34015 RepID=A0A2V3V3J2_9SPHN|nr:DNA topoisomerase IB [Blastomonas natatoria]PXW76333.1 DNA topoisomerase-1 [Blastomonas natatoria]
MSAGDTLVFTSDDMPGITRKRRGKGFSYHDSKGRLIRDKAVRKRIESLAIPPAYEMVWICPDPNGHLQATGRDARGRKQYRYHSAYREQQDAAKFARLASFGAKLPAIRERVERDISTRGTSRPCVLSTIIHLLDCTAIRIGNALYAKENRSYGLTTLHCRHVALEASQIRFRFNGKGGRKWDVSLRHRRVARVLRALQELPGQQLFRYRDGDELRSVSSDDINAYLREIAGEDFSAKDFRTWCGTVTAFSALCELRQHDEPPATEAAIRTAVASAADALGNTPTICRQSYIHPEILEAYREDETLFRRTDPDQAEPAVLKMLKKRG